MATKNVNGVRLRYELTASGKVPLVLVHGSWGDHHIWDGIVPALARSFRVLTYDRRGHSHSQRPAGQGSVQEDVADLAALIEQLDLAPAHILGNSFGAVITLRLAAARPELFRSLLVHEPPLFGILGSFPPAEPIQAAQTRIRAVIDLLQKGEMEAAARQFMDNVAFGPGAWQQFPPEMRRTSVDNAPTFLDEERDSESRTIALSGLAGFSRPMLLTQGDQSAPFFPVIMDKLAEALPGAEHQTLVGTGHVPQVTHPDEYVRTIESFIGRIE
jgi:pimeloyl-ACP methyl ester carboxylesterase